MSECNERNRQFPNKLNTTAIVKMLILFFLQEKNHYGNELIDKIEICLNCKWKPSPGMMYPLLRDMEDNLLITGWWDEPDKKTKRHYKITDIGVKYYDRIKAVHKPLLEESLSIIESTLKTIYR